MLPFFRKSENYVQGGDPDVRGKGGVLQVEDYRTILPLTHRFIEAAQAAGYPYSTDLNGEMQEGVGYSQMTRLGKYRGSTARTFLAAAKGRANLRVETNALATRLVFEGKRCTGVAFSQHGAVREVKAAREVILCGGAVNSPHLLQISGVGPAEHLMSIGVEVVHDLPGVGANLQDHYVSRISHRVRNAISINQLARGIRLAGQVARFFTMGNGALTFGVTSAQVFTRSREGLASPDLQLLFTPASYDPSVFGTLEQEAGMTVAVCPVRPDSRGTIMASSKDPFAKARITPNYLSAPSDGQVLLAGMRKSRAIFAQAPIAQHSVVETLPGPDVDDGRGNAGILPRISERRSIIRSAPAAWARRPDGGGGFAAARARAGRAAGDRCLGDADVDNGQHQRTDDHDRGERRRDDSGGWRGLVLAHYRPPTVPARPPTLPARR